MDTYAVPSGTRDEFASQEHHVPFVKILYLRRYILIGWYEYFYFQIHHLRRVSIV